MLNFSVNFWVKIVLFNLFTIASLGLLMRLKIGFEFPYFDQQNIQHAHSHFAFAGWITQTLLVLITSLVHPSLSNSQLKRYNTILWVNLICSYGMLVSFFIQGYGLYSIAFSTASILLIIVFAILFFRHSAQFVQFPQAIKWFKGALNFAIMSSAGSLALAYMMLGKNLVQSWYLAAVYFYLHFQYNGWFFFACIALFIGQANKHNVTIKNDKLAFGLLFGSCIPAYFLSILWINIPVWLYVIIVVSAIAQAVGWFILLKAVFTYINSNIQSKLCLLLFDFIAISGTLKFFLQLGSTVPFLSHLVFGFRPIVIAYLHLVLLALISMLLILYMYSAQFISNNKLSSMALFCFMLGVLLNELALAVQGLASLSYIAVPKINIVLFFIALLLFLSALGMFLTQFTRRKE